MMEGTVGMVSKLNWPTWLRAINDEAKALELSRLFHNRRIPKPAEDIEARNAAICKRVDALLRENRERPTNRIFAQVGREFGGLSERQVRRIVNQKGD